MSDRDTRRVCRYGPKCYQRNPEHTKKFKHLPLNANKNNDRNFRKRGNPNDSRSSDTPNKRQHLSPNPSEKVIDEPDNEEKVSPEPENVTDAPSEEDETLTSEKVADVADANVEVADAAVADASVADASVADTAGTDASVTDAEVAVADVAVVEAAVAEAAVADAAVADTAVADATVADAAVADAAGADAAGADAAGADAASADAAVADVEIADDVDADVAKADVAVPEQSDSSEPKVMAGEEKTESSDTNKAESKPDQEKIESVEPEKVPDVVEEKQNVIQEPEKVKDIADVKPVEIVPLEEVTNEEVKTEKRFVENYTEANELIAKLFLAPMPKDFFKFYDFCKELKPSDPANALKIVDIKLVGPYDVLNGLIDKDTPPSDDILTHWRYFYDLPEYQTVLKGNDKEGLHFGYWRDRPSSDPIFVALNSSNVSHKFKPTGENLFAAVSAYIEERVKRVNPFEKSSYNNMLAKLKVFAKQNDIILDVLTPKMKSREKNVVSRTIHGAGIVCPYNKKSQLGYRELSVTDNQLLKIVKKIDNVRSTDDERAAARAELSEVVRLATIAGDECDFGTCLELGHDLLSTGCVHVQNAALAVLDIAYNQLERHAFLKIVQAHMKNRKKGTNLSSLRDTSKPSVNLF